MNGSYRVTPEVLSRAKASAVVMHPLPRVGEVTEDCDLDPRAAYFLQMEVRSRRHLLVLYGWGLV